MPILVALLLGIAALAFVLYPLYRRPARVPGAGHPPELSLSGVQGAKPPCRGLGCPQKLSFFFTRRRRRRGEIPLRTPLKLIKKSAIIHYEGR
jgi:hypothetical protein